MTRTTPRFPLGFFAAVFGALVALTTLWSLASPLYSIPDEGSHIVRAAAAVRGQIVEGPRGFDVPDYITRPGGFTCFVGKPTVTPACETPPQVADPDALTWLPSSAGSNSPIYYLVAGLPTLVASGDVALYSMRILSGALAAALLALTATLLRTWPGSRWALIAPILALTPTALFLGGGVNPNVVEMASAGGLVVGLLTLAKRRPSGWVLWIAGILTVASAALVTGGRSVGLLWLVFAALATIVMMDRDDWRAILRRVSTWIVLGLTAAVGGFALFWFTQPTTQVRPMAEPAAGSRWSVFQSMIERTFGYWREMIGSFGWLDVIAPEAVFAILVSALAAVVVAGFVLGRGRERYLAMGFGLALFAVPVVTQLALYRQVGWVWQGRYMLAVLLMLTIFVGLALDRGFPLGLSRNVVAVLRVSIVLVVVAQFLAFFYTLLRYATGSGTYVGLLLHPTWQPPGGTVVLLLLFAAVCALSVVGFWRALPRLLAPGSRLPAL